MLSQEKFTKNSSLLNAEQIAARRIPLENAEVSVRKSNWHCTFCQKRFSSENIFMYHRCEPRRRKEELTTPLGQAALGYYRDWMKIKKFSQPGAAAFMESKYYRSFINFAELVVNANISHPNKYMEMMVQGEILPVLWCREQCYSVYLEWSDRLAHPIDQVQSSINYLLDICEKEGVELHKIFSHLGAQRILSLVRQRRLSPWLIFCSPTFGQLLHEMDKEQKLAFNKVVNASYWAKRFQTERSTIEHIKEIVKEMRL